MPPRPEFVEGWTIGKPDLVLTMPEEFTLEMMVGLVEYTVDGKPLKASTAKN